MLTNVSGMSQFLESAEFNFINADDKRYIYTFNAAMEQRGYGFGGHIGSGYSWGKYMLIYRKSGVKSDKVYARIYLREAEIVLRLFFSAIDQHRSYIESAPPYIKDVFIGPHGQCQHCHNEKEGSCRFRKSYTLEDVFIEKCNGIVFEFHQPNVAKIPDYIRLFNEFYPEKVS